MRVKMYVLLVLKRKFVYFIENLCKKLVVVQDTARKAFRFNYCPALHERIKNFIDIKIFFC